MDWTVEQRAEILALKSEGMSHAQIAKALGVSRNTIVGQVDRMKKNPPPRAPRDRTKKGSAVNTPPSLAMIRLAEFDPVIRRALAVRRSGLQPQPEPSAE